MPADTIDRVVHELACNYPEGVELCDWNGNPIPDVVDLANSTEGDQSDDDYDYVHNSSTVGDNGENELESMGLEDNKNKEEGEDSHGDGDSSSYDTTEVGEREDCKGEL